MIVLPCVGVAEGAILKELRMEEASLAPSIAEIGQR